MISRKVAYYDHFRNQLALLKKPMFLIEIFRLIDQFPILQVLPPAPALHVSFSQTPEEVLAGEIIPIMVNLTNVGTSPIGDVFVAVDTPRWISVNPEEADLPLSVLRNYRNLTNETFSRDKESRKQYCFKLFKPNESSVVAPKETRTSSIWLQAPYKKGKKDIRFLIYYAMAGDYPKLRYRLVRHVWSVNVHESLNVSVDCSVGDADTRGLDLSVKNLNQIHHALMTNIHISCISLFCGVFALKGDLNYLQSPAYQRIFCDNDELGLKSDESIGMRLPLREKDKISREVSFVEFLRSQLSEVTVKEMREVKHQLPDLDTPGGFLMKHETKFVDVYRGTSAEEFSNITSKADPHMTLCVTWKALVNDGSTSQRNTFGQHFVQIRNLFEVTYCPPHERIQNFAGDEFQGVFAAFAQENDDENDEAGGWAPNTLNVAQRCFIDYEVHVTDVVAGEKIKIF